MLELDPDHVQSHNNLGVIYQATGLFDLAQEEFRKAIKIDPTYEPALINLARLYLDLAARQYEDLVKLKPDDPELARAYRQVLALKLRPNYPEAGYRFGMTQYFLDRYAEAASQLEQVVGKEGVDPAEVHHYLGHIYSKLGKEDKAITHLRKALALKDAPQSHWVLGQVYERMKEYAAAEREYREVARLEPNNQEVGARLEELKAKVQPPIVVAQPPVPPPPLKPVPVPLREKGTDQLVLPDFLVGMEGEQSSHILLVEKRDQRLRLYKCQNANCQVVKSYRCSTGQKEGDKRRVGDRRTPEGVYFLVDFKRDKDLAPEYGAGAFPQIQVSISDLKAFHLEDFMVVSFHQGYRSDQRSDEGSTSLTWRPIIPAGSRRISRE